MNRLIRHVTYITCIIVIVHFMKKFSVFLQIPPFLPKLLLFIEKHRNEFVYKNDLGMGDTCLAIKLSGKLHSLPAAL